MKRKINSRGFTLVEVIVSLVIISLIAAVIYSTVSQGIKLWHYALRDRPEWKIDIFFDKFSTQLRNAVDCKTPPFTGGNQTVEFCIPGQAQGKDGKEIKFIAAVKYFYDPLQKTVMVQKKNYQQAVDPKNTAPDPVPALSGINDFRIEYYEKEEKKKDWQWLTKWNKTCFPAAVKISLNYGSTNPKNMTRYFHLMTTESCGNGQA